MKDVCRELGFVSPNVQAYTKKSSDHQKVWVILEICYIAFSDYMFFQFIKYCGNGNIVPTNENYWRFIFVQQVGLTYLHTLMLLRAGVHNNQPQDIYAAKNKLSLVFFGHNHWHYHFIISQEKMINFLIPRQIKDLKDSSLALIRMKRTGHFQAGMQLFRRLTKRQKGILSEFLVIYNGNDHSETLIKRIKFMKTCLKTCVSRTIRTSIKPKVSEIFKEKCSRSEFLFTRADTSPVYLKQIVILICLVLQSSLQTK